MKVALLVAVSLAAPFADGADIWYVDASADIWGDGRSWESAFTTIGRALQSAYGGDTVIVAQGTYRERLQIDTRTILVTSKEPLNPNVVANTIIDGGAEGPVVTFWGHESERCVLQGFTITNGSAPSGGGINGNGTLATIRYNVITWNVAYGGPWPHHGCGGGIYRCNGVIENNVISENVAGDEDNAGDGGAMAYCAGTVRRNTIIRNRVVGKTCNPEFPWNCDTAVAPGLWVCNGTIEGNFIAENYSEFASGEGICESWGRIVRNTLTGNSGGGIVSCGGEILQNLVAFNPGAGIYGCEGFLSNNVVFGNAGTWAVTGGLGECSGIITNCIVWGNGSPDGRQVADSDLPTYSCIQGWTGGGKGNINLEPKFVDAEKGDFRLLPDSPCIDAGDNNVADLPDTDILGMHRIMYGGRSLTVDMGAYEFYINDLTRGPNPDETTFTWSSLADKS